MLYGGLKGCLSLNLAIQPNLAPMFCKEICECAHQPAHTALRSIHARPVYHPETGKEHTGTIHGCRRER